MILHDETSQIMFIEIVHAFEHSTEYRKVSTTHAIGSVRLLPNIVGALAHGRQ